MCHMRISRKQSKYNYSSNLKEQKGMTYLILCVMSAFMKVIPWTMASNPWGVNLFGGRCIVIASFLQLFGKQHVDHESYRDNVVKMTIAGCSPLHLVFLCYMMTSSNGNIFGVTGYFCGEFTGPR